MQQQQRQALNLINIFTACPDADYDNSNEQPALLIVRDLIKSKATGFTDKELNSIDTYLLMHLSDEEYTAKDFNWCFKDDMRNMMNTDIKYTDITSPDYFVEQALATRARALQQRHHFVLCDMYVDVMLTQLYLKLLEHKDYRLEFFRDYAEAVTTAVSNLDASMYTCL